MVNLLLLYCSFFFFLALLGPFFGALALLGFLLLLLQCLSLHLLLPRMLHLAAHLSRGSNASPFDALSQRELQVMYMLTQGLGTQAISDRLCLSPKTVSTYRYRLFEKLGVHNDVELTRLAMRYDMLDDAKGQNNAS